MKWYRGYILFLAMVVLSTSFNSALCQDCNPDSAINILERTIAPMPDDSLKIKRIDSVAFCHTNVDTIIKYAEWEMDLSKKLGLLVYEAKANNYLGYAYYYKYNFAKAVEFYTKAISLSDSVVYRRGMARYRFALANTYAMIDDYLAANRLYCEALDYFNEMDDTELICETYRSLAMINIDFQLANSAEEFLLNAMALDSANNNRRGVCLNFYYLGRVERLRYNMFGTDKYLNRAVDNMRKALKGHCVGKFNEMHIDFEMMNLYLLLARNNKNKKELYLDQSRKYHNRAFVLAEELGVATDTRDFQLWQAVYLAEKGDYENAYPIFKAVEANYVADSSLVYTEFYIRFFKCFGYFYELTENYKSALEYYKKSDNLRLEIYNREFAVETAKYREEVKHQKENAAHIKANNEAKAKTRYAVIALVSVLVLLGFITKSYFKNKRTNKILLDSNAEIEMQRDQLKHINDEITSSLRYAQKIQEASLPQRESLEVIFGNCLLYWKPLDLVSGDFYWAQQTFRYKFLAVGDCTGHGVPGAFLSMLGISSLTDIVMSIDFEKWTPSASEILDQLRAKVISSLRQSVENEEDTKDGIDIALCIFDTQQNELHFCGAMRPIVIFRDGKCLTYSGDRIPVGVSFKQNMPFTNHIIKVLQGDTIYLFTDGVVDQFGFVDGVETKFNRKRLCAMLSQIHSMPFEAQESRIEAVFEHWAAQGGIVRCPQVDDRLMIGIRV